jgi:two-component system nitrogen regulation sensor histidine kinase GlnL
LLKKIETYTSLQAEAFGLTHRFEYGQVPLVKINPFQMEQAILNIVNNSIDAMVGGGELMVRSSTESIEGRDFAIVEISDTGPGMTDTRLVETPVPTIGAVNGTGRGFGLFIAREVIQHHGGRLEIRSVKGAGTTVKVCLPAM